MWKGPRNKPTYMIFTTLAILSPLAVVLTSAQVVDLGYASYQGTLNTTTGDTRFLGIRYAAPPTGSQRWQPPRTPDTVQGIIQANVEPPGCPSAGDGISPTNPQPHDLAARATEATSEDCLFLNVFTPQMPGADTKAKPVVVWIHGGGYQAGSAAGFSGEDLIREANGGVVAVVIQYRLGVYGFLAGKEVKSEGVLNAGLLDQEFALQWVQTNIAKFGGDPAQVAIWGESAGAGSVLQHVIAHDGKTSPPLFRAAITSSTFLPSQYAFDDIIPQTLYNEVVSQASCTSAADTLACLRASDPTTLQTINVNLSTSAFFGTFIFVPVVDGSFITQRPTQAMKEHKVNGEVLLAVTNTFEGFIFVNQNTADTVTTPEYVSQLFPKFGPQEIAMATSQYADLGAPIDQVNAIQGEAIFICPTYFLLNAFKNTSFKGQFAIPPAHHGDDVVYYFPSPGVPPFSNPDFDTAFSHSFLDFAMSLDPNIKPEPTITPQWSIWAEGLTEMIFNRTAAGTPVVEPIKTSSSLLQRCSFWDSVGALSGQ